MPFRLSPSRLARFYFHECERFLRYAATPARQRAADGVPKPGIDRSLITRTILEAGYSWERTLVEGTLGSAVVIAPGPVGSPVTDRKHSPEQTLAALGQLRPGEWLYQPSLRAGAGFQQRYGLDADLVEFADCFPDLLLARQTGDARPALVVVDAKASDMMKLSHRIQVALYALLLDQFLSDSGLDSRFQVADEGGVWLYGQPQPEMFPLERIRPALEHFLRHELTPILTGAASEVFWHLYYRCEWCDYFAHCRNEAEERSDVSLLPYLSTYAKRHLRERSVQSVAGLAQVLSSEDAAGLLAGSASLEGRRNQLLQASRALLDGGIQHTGAAHCGMPRGENVRLVLTLQQDPLSGQMYGWAVNRIGGKAALGTSSSTEAFVAASVGELPLARSRLVTALHALLARVHDHNSTREWRDQLSVQLYVFDTYERDLLVELLLASLDDEACREQAIRLLFYVQQPELALAEEHPDQEIVYPLIVLLEVVRGLFTLPVPVVYRFSDVVAALQPSFYGFTYDHDDLWDFQLSNRLKTNALLMAWNGGRPEMLDAIERRLKIRVWAANAVINGIRERLEGSGALFAWPPKFVFPSDMDLADPLLSRLAFLVRYESVLGCIEAGSRRALPEEQRLTSGDTLRLRSMGGGWFELDPQQNGMDLREDTWPNFLLTRDDDEGRRARLAFNDFRWRQAMWPPKHLPVAYAAITAVDPARQRVRLDVTGHSAWALVQPGERFSLDTRYIDVNSHKLLAEIVAESQSGTGWFTDLLREPAGTARVLPADAVAASARALAEPHMTRSQRDAFDSLLRTNCALVWGPPGTGKTHFLALAILALAAAHYRYNRPLRIAVVGFTHTAIDNLLTKISDLRRLFPSPVDVRKIGEYAPPGTPLLKPAHIPSHLAMTSLAVHGSTVWQLIKVQPSDCGYDMLVIDEGSQLKVAEALPAIRRLKAGGRLVIAGDHLQLPPIFAGRYPAAADGEPETATSVLRAIRERPGGCELTSTLLENFRMCDVLSAYPASTIYPPDYRPYNEEVAHRRLRLKSAPTSGKRADALADLALEPRYPLVVGVLDGVKATAHNPMEAAIVADIVDALRQRIDGDDKTFWHEQLFVVSPHHVQIRAIRRELARRRTWAYPPFVDTVDKMQGQEADCVIISYGVADVETALRENEFIYSLNRMNVALTRGRAKTIVLLSRQLLDPPVAVLEEPSVAEGVAFIQGLADWAEAGSNARIQLTQTIQMTLLRR